MIEKISPLRLIITPTKEFPEKPHYKKLFFLFGPGGTGASIWKDDGERVAHFDSVELAEFLSMAADMQMEILHDNGKL